MEVITIESRAYQDLMQKLHQLCEHIQFFSQAREAEKHENRDVWLDSKAVCQRLNISSRTLHRMKKERKISFSVLRGRYRYKQSDVERLLGERHVVSNPETRDELYPTIFANLKH
jgi:excisionase family DNA binding protein